MLAVIFHTIPAVLYIDMFGLETCIDRLLTFPIFVEIPSGCVEFNRGVRLDNKNAAWTQRTIQAA